MEYKIFGALLLIAIIAGIVWMWFHKIPAGGYDGDWEDM